MGEDEEQFMKFHNTCDTTPSSLLWVIPIYLLDLLHYYLQKDNFHQLFLALYPATGKHREYGQKPQQKRELG